MIMVKGIYLKLTYIYQKINMTILMEKNIVVCVLPMIVCTLMQRYYPQTASRELPRNAVQQSGPAARKQLNRWEWERKVKLCVRDAPAHSIGDHSPISRSLEASQVIC